MHTHKQSLSLRISRLQTTVGSLDQRIIKCVLEEDKSTKKDRYNWQPDNIVNSLSFTDNETSKIFLASISSNNVTDRALLHYKHPGSGSNPTDISVSVCVYGVLPTFIKQFRIIYYSRVRPAHVLLLPVDHSFIQVRILSGQQARIRSSPGSLLTLVITTSTAKDFTRLQSPCQTMKIFYYIAPIFACIHTYT